ncbi:MAG: ClpXP protease specificity-enhancing factor SspB [Dissulfurispiraceae bacterium]|jgi:hypothetical protein|nr:ClpXP protease specificity-enhancing factor SspB [Dissulfurispiraceae bacterium]
MSKKLDVNDLKKDNFYHILDMAGRVFILVKYSPDVIIGKRGFTEQEKKQGLVLVFNTNMNFQWDDYGISATLAFGTVPQKCVIPAEHIAAVYSPDMNVQFLAAGSYEQKSEPSKEQPPDARPKGPGAEGSSIVKVDFSKKEKI